MTKTSELARKPRWAGIQRTAIDSAVPIIEGFELEWQAGRIPLLRPWLQRNQQTVLAQVLLEELLEIDILSRQQRGLPCDLTNYTSSMPELESLLRQAWERIEAVRPFQSLMTQSVSLDLNPAAMEGATEPRDAASQGPTSIGRYQIEKLLGRGGFGTVYLAKDMLLHRPVAIKVPHSHLVRDQADADLYLNEARTVASLNHPNIVPVYDVGGVAEFPLFIVSQYIAGKDLASHIKQKSLSTAQAIEVVATIAQALHYAHQHGLVHRDIKPANILIDEAGQPYIVDFGLALRDADLGRGPRLAGTPAYMSPEQARDEGHRVDGRSDVFSLGSVLYQLLTDRLPFLGDSVEALLEQISNCEARPLRQINHSLPKELERICLKALAKRLSDRYTNAFDMAEDLQVFLQSEQASKWLSSDKRPQALSGPAKATSAADPQQPESAERRQPLSDGLTPTSTPTPTSGGVPPGLHVVPKGLRSFDEYDAEFFTELLPGPRDRNGLPESIRFWKTRLEQLSGDKTFSVGLLYGPSGCGKSSLMKAGVLPRLGENVRTVYVEAAYGITESRLSNAVSKALSSSANAENHSAADLQANSLSDLLALCRRGHFLPAGQKLVIVIDQFEQWLLDWHPGIETELIRALRHCDGARVQCVIMVRDDFWLATSRFMQALEIPLTEHHNAELVDLFDLGHARKVLRYIGMAYECLPENEADFTNAHREFLKNAAEELSQDGKVICVRLAMLAEMLKSKEWNTKTLREMGGIDGVGVAFLEDSFGSRHAPREHAIHQEAARCLLRELLPESTSDVKGRMRTYDDLIRAVGYEKREQDFLRLLAILDGNLRLITPVELPAETASAMSSSTPSQPGSDRQRPEERGPQQAYQLTHDFLVQAVRTWIELKQRETWRGRAELKLVDRTNIWHATQETRQLPNIIEWFQISLLTRPGNWSARQATMMKSAKNHHVRRLTLTLASFALAGCLIYLTISQVLRETRLSSHAARLVQSVLTAPLEELPTHIQAAQGESNYTIPLLQSELAKPQANNQFRTRASLALLASDRSQADFLYKQLLSAEPEFLPVLRAGLEGYRQTIVEKLRREFREFPTPTKPLNRLAAMSLFDPDHDQWKNEWAARVMELLEECDRNELPAWLAAFENNRSVLLDHVRGANKMSSAVRSAILSRYAMNDVDLIYEKFWDLDLRDLAPIARILERSAAKYEPLLKAELKVRVPLSRDSFANYEFDIEEERHQHVERKLRAAAMLMLWNDFQAVWDEACRPEDPRLASELVSSLSVIGLAPQKLIDQLNAQSDVRIRQLIVLALGKYAFGSLSRSERDTTVDALADLYKHSTDSGLRSSANWTLRAWGQREVLRQADNSSRDQPDPNRNWYIDSSGIPMAIVRGPTRAIMGAGPLEWSRQLAGESNQHRVQIDPDFAIGLYEVTLSQFKKCHEEYRQYFRKDLVVDLGWSNRSLDAPATSLSYWDAALFCHWLGKKEDLTDAEQCYPPPDQIKPGMKLPLDFLERKGYRLPTRAEWEVACRAGTTSPLNFGSRFSPHADYTWSIFNSGFQNHPVGELMPNRLGLFDIHGNSFEWCANVYTPSMNLTVDETLVDGIGPNEFHDEQEGVLKGGEFPSNLGMHSAAYQNHPKLKHSWPSSSFRVARTLHSPPLSCTIARHLGDSVQYNIAGANKFEILAVTGPVQVHPREDNGVEVTSSEGNDAPCRYSFELRPVGKNESVKVSGELVSCEMRARFYTWDHDPNSMAKHITPDFAKRFSDSNPYKDDVLTLSQLKHQFAAESKDSKTPVAVWGTGKLKVAGGRYEFWTKTNDSLRVSIDDQLVINTFSSAGLRTMLETIDLSPGDHTILLEYADLDPPMDFSLSIVPAN